MVTLAPDNVLLAILRTLRRSLYACAEPSNEESTTARVISEFLRAYAPDELLTCLGGHGVAGIFEGDHDGPTVLIRCELDALPIEEFVAAGSPHRAIHRCGHDGHMTMVAGLAPLLAQRRPRYGRVVLLFQPAEETGKGALAVLGDTRFPTISPDYAIALHNLPGFERNTIVCRPGVFASASGGLRIRFQGSSSHAAEPEMANSPRNALSRLLAELPAMSDLRSTPYRMLTITHVQMGADTFGLTPGDATLCATLRSETTEGLESLCSEVENEVRRAVAVDGIETRISRTDGFPETINHEKLVNRLMEVCGQSGIRFQENGSAFRWSEDFGHFRRVCPTLYFGLGIGEDVPGLHQPGYQFPDEVIPSGLGVFHGLLRSLTDQMNACTHAT